MALPPLSFKNFDAEKIFRDHPLFTPENIYKAYRRCRKHKRKTVNAMRFEKKLEENILELSEELRSGAYRPGRSIAFLVDKPKLREIFAADFRDRVVHHILVGRLEPRWERRFIHDSYACRKKKGTHGGVERLRSFTRKATADGRRRAWYLQLDIRGFFISIDRGILYDRIAAKEDDPVVRWLARTLIFHEPTQNCRLRRTRWEDFERLPECKTLFKAGPFCGLPIGNLTSQFFANVYLDALASRMRTQFRCWPCDCHNKRPGIRCACRDTSWRPRWGAAGRYGPTTRKCNCPKVAL